MGHPDIGGKGFEGKSKGGFDEHVHGKMGGGKHKHENETCSGEKKSDCSIEEKHYAHIK